MRFSELRDNVIDNIDSGIATHLKSSPGRGKSEFVTGLIDYLSARDGEQWGLATCFLATMTPSDLMGYMIPTKLDNGQIASVFSIPPWMMTKPTKEHPKGQNINEFKRGIVFLDEFGQADGDTKKAAAELMLNGRIGQHQLHSGIAVIAASNLKGDRSGVTKDFDFLINRQCEITITDDIVSWTEWATGHGISATTIAFANQNIGTVFASGVPAEQGPWTTPRSLVMADRLMQRKAARNKKNPGQMPYDPETIEQITGIMGGGALQYFNFVKLAAEMPTYEDIVKDPKKAKCPSKPDAQMLICYSLANRVKVEDAGAVIEYVERMSKEFSVTFATAAVKYNNRLVFDRAFHEWAKANSSLMASISAPTR